MLLEDIKTLHENAVIAIVCCLEADYESSDYSNLFDAVFCLSDFIAKCESEIYLAPYELERVSNIYTGMCIFKSIRAGTIDLEYAGFKSAKNLNGRYNRMISDSAKHIANDKLRSFVDVEVNSYIKYLSN